MIDRPARPQNPDRGFPIIRLPAYDAGLKRP